MLLNLLRRIFEALHLVNNQLFLVFLWRALLFDSPLRFLINLIQNQSLESFFQQKNYLKSSITPDKSLENFNHSFRYLRDKNVNNDKLIKINEETFIFENTINAWGYYTDGIIRKKIDFNSNFDVPLVVKIYDYYSGAYSNEFNIDFKNEEDVQLYSQNYSDIWKRLI